MKQRWAQNSAVPQGFAGNGSRSLDETGLHHSCQVCERQATKALASLNSAVHGISDLTLILAIVQALYETVGHCSDTYVQKLAGVLHGKIKGVLSR